MPDSFFNFVFSLCVWPLLFVLSVFLVFSPIQDSKGVETQDSIWMEIKHVN